DVEEVLGAEVAVTVGRAAVDAGGLDLDLDERALRVRLVDADGAPELPEATADRREHHVLDHELHGRVGRVDLPEVLGPLLFALAHSVRLLVPSHFVAPRLPKEPLPCQGGRAPSGAA